MREGRGREGGREGGMERGMDGWMDGWREGGREGGEAGGREEYADTDVPHEENGDLAGDPEISAENPPFRSTDLVSRTWLSRALSVLEFL
eukprot:3778737-Rhodomonas_salina.1